MEAAQHTTQRSTPELAEAHGETCQHTKACSTQYSRTKQSSVPQQWRRTATPPAASTNTSPTPNAQVGGQTHHTGTSPMHSHRRPQTRHARKPQRQAPGLGVGPANEWAALSKRFGGYPNSAGEQPCPGSHGRHTSQRQRSAQHGDRIAHNAAHRTKAGRGTQ